MPVPFRDADDIQELGAAGYLRIDPLPDGSRVRGSLFLVNARGEPLEFTYNSVDIPGTFLWRQDDVRKSAVRTLVTSLFATCSKVPIFILCFADEVYHELFSKEIALSIPVCRIASFAKAVPHSKLEVEDTVEQPEPTHLFWFPGKPADQSLERRLVDRLASGGLLTEPLERALVGLREVYPSEQSQA
ncbi:MAG: hypothetical protein Q7R39_13490 [Dehalococcoidia bacterium]|nr:hypothetical protein [Dehalococcoidia bacterium]